MHPQTLSQKKELDGNVTKNTTRKRLEFLQDFLVQKHAIMNPSERYFYRNLEKWVQEQGNNWLIFSKVRLGDIVELRKDKLIKSGEVFRWMNEWNQINKKHFDFVITNVQWHVLYCIELNWTFHLTSESQRSDAIKEELCAALGIRLIRINRHQWSYYGDFRENLSEDRLISSISV